MDLPRIDPVQLASATLSAEAALSAVRNDPLKWFRCSSVAQRRFIGALDVFDEVYMRAGQQSGKTVIGARCAVALMRGCEELDGEKLPHLGVPNVGVLLVQSYKQAEQGAIAALLDSIGDWPHHIVKVQNTIQAVYVRPERSRSEDHNKWSKCIIMVSQGEFPSGMRLDWVWADEPPKEHYWTELRSRGKANRKFIKFITATPLDRREWGPLKEWYRGCEWPDGNNGRVEIRMSVYDNTALSAEHLKRLEREWKDDDLRDAKLMGEYVHAFGKCPFDSAGLVRWGSRCEKGMPLESDPRVTWWADKCHCVQRKMMLVADPSAGIFDAKNEHDPAGLIVGCRICRQVVARYNGYLQAHELGRMARGLADNFGRALVVHERNSGYGESFLLGLGNYGNVYIEHHGDRMKAMTERIGWATTATSRGVIVGAVQKAIREDTVKVYSRECVDSLADVIIGADGKIQAAAGCHDEDMIIVGLFAHLCETLPVYVQENVDMGKLVRERYGIVGSVADGDDFAVDW